MSSIVTAVCGSLGIDERHTRADLDQADEGRPDGPSRPRDTGRGTWARRQRRGKLLRIGTYRIRLYGETRPCEQMEAAHAGLQAVMRERWGGGAFAEVLEGGEIRIGDAVEWDCV